MPQQPRHFGDSGNIICEDPNPGSTTSMLKCRRLRTLFLDIRIRNLPGYSRRKFSTDCCTSTLNANQEITNFQGYQSNNSNSWLNPTAKSQADSEIATNARSRFAAFKNGGHDQVGTPYHVAACEDFRIRCLKRMRAD